MKKLVLLFAFAICLFVSNNLMAATTTDVVTPVENVTTETVEAPSAYYVNEADLADLIIIVCASGGVDLYINDEYIGTYDCVIIIL